MALVGGEYAVGPYQVTYKGNDIGLTEGPIRHQHSIDALPIRAALYGSNILDYIFQGASVFVVLTIKEWKTDSRVLMDPWGLTAGIFPSSGMLLSAYFGAVVMTALTGTPAQTGAAGGGTEGPLTRTYTYAGIFPGHSIDIPLGAVERNIPMVICVLPEKDGSNVRTKQWIDTYP